MNIRRYLEGEEPAIWQMYYSATRISVAKDYHRELIDRWAPHDKNMTQWAKRLKEKNPFIAVIGDEIVGMAEIDREGFIDYFYVHPSHQGRGIGKRLMDTLITEAKTHALERAFANVSKTAKTFFESQNFEVTETRKNIILNHVALNFRMARTL